MYRFHISPGINDIDSQAADLRLQIDRFLQSDALNELLSILRVDRSSLSQVYNGRAKQDGRVLETMELSPLDALEKHRDALYPLFRELGFLDINKPILPGCNRILVLGGSMNVCRMRTGYAARWITDLTESVDGLTCYRPVSPGERKASSCASAADTEFGILSEAFAETFALRSFEDAFIGDRNLNRISCVRTFGLSEGACRFSVYAAPSTQPDTRRADTGDTVLFYLDKAAPAAEDRLLFITNNRYCNRQFLQIACQMLIAGRLIPFDIIGCFSDEEITPRDRYDPFQYLQDLIGILDTAESFSRMMRNRH